MKRRYVSNIVYSLVLTMLLVGIIAVYYYSNFPYFGIVEINFHAQVVAYKQDGGDYAFITLDHFLMNFTRSVDCGSWWNSGLAGNSPCTPVLQYPKNQTTKTISYSGKLDRTLTMSLNITLASASIRIILPTHNVSLDTPGYYSVVFTHLFPSIPAGAYLVNLTYTGSVHQRSPWVWTTNLFFFRIGLAGIGSLPQMLGNRDARSALSFQGNQIVIVSFGRNRNRGVRLNQSWQRNVYNTSWNL